MATTGGAHRKARGRWWVIRPRTRRALGAIVISATLVFGTSSIVWAKPTTVVAASVDCATSSPTPTAAPVLAATAGSPGGLYAGVALSGSQVDAAATIVNVGLDAGITRRGIRIAIAAAMMSSSLNPQASNARYLGLFQQRSDPSSGLYTSADRLAAVGATRMFFEQLLARVPGYETDVRSDAEIGDLVQESGDPALIDGWAPLAETLTAKFIPVVEPTAEVAPAPAAPLVLPTRTLLSGSRGWNVPNALRSPGVAFAAIRQTATAGTATTPGLAAGASAATPAGATTTTAGRTTTGVATTVVSTVVTSTAATTPATHPATTDPAATVPSTSATTASHQPSGTATTGTATTAGSTTSVSATSVSGTTSGGSTGTSVGTSGSIDPSTSTDPSTSSDPSTAATSPEPSSPSAGNSAPSLPAPAEPAPPADPAIADTPAAPVPSGNQDDPGVGPDSIFTPPQPAGLVGDCGTDNNGGSTTFDPDFIISDQVFYNTASMTADQIAAFIADKGASCTGAYCLQNIRISSDDIAADAYCTAYTGGAADSAAEVIAKVSAACGINPQVMLVTLQKESALLTRTDVSASSYNAAWGWHCPDSGPGGSANCDPAHAGFFNQAYGMAKQWSRYRVDPDKYNFKAGDTKTILWNVAQTNCGGSTVHIQNTATASLYNYTPYQPNAAALSSYPGVGDGCSAYGNRNFFFLFQKYFGVTGGGLSAAVAINGVDVTIPVNAHVATAARGMVVHAPTQAVANGLAAGFAAIGLPYVWGGGTDGSQADQGCSRGGGSKNSCAGTVGFDCSGLTGYVLSQAGFGIGTNSAAQRAGGNAVAWSQALPGDIIGYSGHVAVYLGAINGVDYLLEAPDVNMFVQIRPVYLRNNGAPVDSVVHRYWS